LGAPAPHPVRRVRGDALMARPDRPRRAAALAVLRAVAASILLASLTPIESGGAGDRVITVTTRPNVTETVAIVRPPDKPVAIVVVLVGGSGKLDLTPLGFSREAPGLLVKRRAQLAGRGFVVAFPDAPSDRLGQGLLGFRTTREHSVDIGAVIARLRRDDPAPVWLVGMSMGTVSAASAAARLGRDGPDGLVLVSSVTRTHPSMRESLRDVALEEIRVPALVIHHRDDPCETTPYADAAALPARLTKATPRVELVTLAGGPPRGGLPCGAESPHAFFGIEDTLIDRLASWIGHPPAR
jgi:pimeloyl-ACP methyl ester carboxylesterase